MIHDYYILIIKEMSVNQGTLYLSIYYPLGGILSTKPVIPRNPGSEKGAKEGTRPTKLLNPRISLGHFFLAVFFRVTHDGINERGTSRSLAKFDDRNENCSFFS